MEIKKLYKYLTATFLISWISWWLLAFLTTNDILEFTDLICIAIFSIGGFGPTIATILLIPNKSFKAIKKFVFNSEKNSLKWLLLFCILELVVIGVSSMKVNPATPYYAIPFILIQTIFIGGGNEELGWRGVMQPILENKVSFPVATIITGLVWGLWHLPLWFVVGSAQSNMTFILFVVFAILLSFWLATVYKKSQSVFYCCILHGASNLFLSLFIIKVNLILILGLLAITTLSIFLFYSNKSHIKLA